MMRKNVECQPEKPDKCGNNQLPHLGLCAPAIFLQKWDIAKCREKQRERGLVDQGATLSSYIYLTVGFIQEKQTLKEVEEKAVKKTGFRFIFCLRIFTKLNP